MKKKTVYLKKWITTVTIMFLAALALPVQAQNVTISPQNGSMICANAQGQGTSGGAFAMWRHEQLALTMIASGSTDLTEDGILRNHRNWFNTCEGCTFSSPVSDAVKATYIDCGWQDGAGYYTISLPKGYRFTSYRFELSHDITDTGQGFTTVTNTSVTMGQTDEDFNAITGRTVTLPAVPASGSDVQVITLEHTGNDMGNVLYFKTTAPTGNQTRYYDLTFRHVELTFAADADTPIDITPSSQVTTARTMLEVPFNTGKVDVGEVTSQEIPNSGNRISYSLNSFKDMKANMLLYEYDSTTDDTGFDGTSGKVAYNKTTGGTITTSGNYFRFAPAAITDPNKPNEKLYVLETPVSAVQAGNIENPVQFRITGATINYKSEGDPQFYITCEIEGVTYYLNTSCRFTTDEQIVWQIDASGHIYSGSSYLQGTDGQLNTGSARNATVYQIDDNKNIRYQRYNGTYRYLRAHANYRNEGSWLFPDYVFDHYSGYITSEAESGTAVVVPYESTDGSSAKIYIYDKEGNKDSRYPNGVSVGSGSNVVELNDLNNDAIIFGVEGGKVALLNFQVKLQALNPFIDQMTVVLNVKKQDGTDVRMTRPFTSNDFSVGGDRFEFYLPAELKNRPVDMTFEDLYSKYGDETYDHITGTEHSSSRYNFVKSQHNAAYGETDNIYNNKAEASSGTLESYRLAANNGLGQNVRTKVGTVGNEAFVFNNAEELSSNEGYLREFPFTLYNYAHQSQNENLNPRPSNGQFIAAHFDPTEVDVTGVERHFYVFTTDETRYNIAPTTATQHRAYAYYKMTVFVKVKTYTPEAIFEPIYKNAFYQDETGKDTTGDFFGVKITVDDSSVANPLASDVAINKAIITKIKEDIVNASSTDNITSVDDVTDAQVSAEMKKILYLDASDIGGVYHTTPTVTTDEPYAVESFNALKDKFDLNALVFLPADATDKYNNFAYAKKGEVKSFQSANNIILTDKHPFYSPYNIQVDAANYARYTRQLTKSSYADELWATIIMPFTIQLSSGQHSDSYGTLEFLQMNTTQATSNDDDYGTAFFSKTTASEVAANTPYALHVISNSSDGQFTINQSGSNIVATPDAAKNVDGGNTLFSATALTSTGNLKDKDNVSHQYTFSHKGTFSGQMVPKDDPKTFYFANNGFYSSADLSSRYSTVDIFPFRSVYEVIGGSAKVGFLRIVEGVNENETDGINAVRTEMNVDENAPVYDMQGRMIAPRMSDLKNKNLDRGIYVVNGVKFIVK